MVDCHISPYNTTSFPLNHIPTQFLHNLQLRIGPEFQAGTLPAFSPDYTSAATAQNSCTLVWSPPSREAEEGCATFSKEVVQGLERPTLPLEAALCILHELKYDTAQAIRRFRDSYQVSCCCMSCWVYSGMTCRVSTLLWP